MNLQVNDKNEVLQPPNLELFFPELRNFFLSTSFNSKYYTQTRLHSTKFFQNLNRLETLKLLNIDFEFDEQKV